MKPTDIGFRIPCRHCARQIWDDLGAWCRAHCPTTLDYASVVPGKGPLFEVSGPSRSGAEGYSRYFACRRCSSRWRIFDWVYIGWVNYNQESADSLYYCDGQFVDGKKDGWHNYGRYEPVPTTPTGPLHCPMMLSELWDHGRLVERKEYGPVHLDDRGEPRQSVVRTWRARR
jgi:hypothetical protein